MPCGTYKISWIDKPYQFLHCINKPRRIDTMKAELRAMQEAYLAMLKQKEEMMASDETKVFRIEFNLPNKKPLVLIGASLEATLAEQLVNGKIKAKDLVEIRNISAELVS